MYSLPAEIGFTEAADDRTEDGAADRREDDECHGVLLLVGFPKIRYHTQSDGAAGRRQAAQSTTDDDGSEIGRQGHRDLPDVDQTQRELENGPAAELEEESVLVWRNTSSCYGVEARAHDVLQTYFFAPWCLSTMISICLVLGSLGVCLPIIRTRKRK